MPLYEYYCDTCGDTFELSRLIKDRDEPAKSLCGICDGLIYRKVSYGGFRKGEGAWESNGYNMTLKEMHKHNDEGKIR